MPKGSLWRVLLEYRESVRPPFQDVAGQSSLERVMPVNAIIKLRRREPPARTRMMPGSLIPLIQTSTKTLAALLKYSSARTAQHGGCLYEAVFLKSVLAGDDTEKPNN